MAAVIPSKILGFRGQCVKSVDWDVESERLQVLKALRQDGLISQEIYDEKAREMLESLNL